MKNSLFLDILTAFLLFKKGWKCLCQNFSLTQGKKYKNFFKERFWLLLIHLSRWLSTQAIFCTICGLAVSRCTTSHSTNVFSMMSQSLIILYAQLTHQGCHSWWKSLKPTFSDHTKIRQFCELPRSFGIILNCYQERKCEQLYIFRISHPFLLQNLNLNSWPWVQHSRFIAYFC